MSVDGGKVEENDGATSIACLDSDSNIKQLEMVSL